AAEGLAGPIGPRAPEGARGPPRRVEVRPGTLVDLCPRAGRNGDDARGDAGRRAAVASPAVPGRNAAGLDGGRSLGPGGATHVRPRADPGLDRAEPRPGAAGPHAPGDAHRGPRAELADGRGGGADPGV